MSALDLKAKWRRGEASPGVWMHLTDPTVAEIIGLLHPDWVMIDAEHAALDLQSLQTLLIALEHTCAVPLVRVPSGDPIYIKRVLDMGAMGVLVPQISAAEEVRRAVAACKYPPQGTRGAGPRRPSRYGMQEQEYLLGANDQTIVLVMIEHVDAVREIDAILATPGLDGIVIGPLDLSASMGLLPDIHHPEVEAAIGQVAESALVAGVPFGSGRMLGTYQEIATWLARGARLISIGDDQGFVQQGARAALDLFSSMTNSAVEGQGI